MKTLCIIAGLLSSFGAAHAQLDLHAHLDMKPGMGAFELGGFFEAPRAADWKSRLKSKASALSLTPGFSPKLIVVSFYAHPYFSNLFHFDLKENVSRALDQEYEDLVKFTDRHASTWAIAKNAAEARIALRARKSVFVLSIEGANDALETEADLKKWIDERGVAIVTPFHLTEDHFGGVALFPNLLAVFNTPINFIQSLSESGGSCLFHFCKSTVGIKPDGKNLIQSLLEHRVWIDLAHANELAIDELLPELKTRKLPLLITHTQIREVYPAERAMTLSEAKYLEDEDGMIGLIPSQDMMPRPLGDNPGCHSGLVEFQQAFRYARQRLGELKVALGSDVNAPLKGLSPACRLVEGQIPSKLEQDGYYTYSQWSELSNYVSESADWNNKIVERFLSLWEIVRP